MFSKTFRQITSAWFNIKSHKRGVHPSVGSSIVRHLRFPPLLGSSVVVGTYFGYLLLTDKEPIPEYYPNSLNATLLRRLPFNGLSRLLCWIAECRIPTVLRPFVFNSYASMFSCDLSEMKHPELRSYSTISDFFTREVAHIHRPIDENAVLVCPSDGQIMHFGTIDPRTGVLEQVKGVNYSLKEFLGPIQLPVASDINSATGPAGKQLFQCVIYLGPGDCHRFYSPGDWTASVRRHFAGKLISVRPYLASNLPGLFALNERVVYLGHWSHGFMSLAAVGAVGVGGIRIHSDPSLITNSKRRLITQTGSSCVRPYGEISLFNKSTLHKGDEFGMFTFGSTIVLIFEAPSDAEWCIKVGDRVRFGQALMNAIR